MMGVALAVLGGVIAVVTFMNGIGISPSNAPQQAVQELRFVEAILGLVVLGLGCVQYRRPIRGRLQSREPIPA
jgi:hypothetical protein